MDTLVYKDASDVSDDDNAESDSEEIKEIPLGQAKKRRQIDYDDVDPYGMEDDSAIDDSVSSSDGEQ